ncbi:MAG: hypothetical protein JWR49_2843 [Tardiphaga sp.]|nr:hypothetical protein [Tardiphaga sp.]
MPGLLPGIHVFSDQDVDGRDKPGHDVERLLLGRIHQHQLGIF